MALKLLLILTYTLFSSWLLAQEASFRKLTEKHPKESKKFNQAFEAQDVSPEKFSNMFKEDLWKAYEQKVNEILKSKKLNSEVQHQHEEFTKLKERLTALEYQEEEVDAKEEKVTAHMKLLNEKEFHKNQVLFFDFISWQDKAQIKSPAAKADLVMTNIGYCAGGGVGRKSAFYHLFVDGCFMFGYGNVSSAKNTLTYKQSNVPYYGIKTSLGGGMIVSSKGAEVGFKLPVFYTDQDLDNPDQSLFPGSKVDTDSDLKAMLSLYSRWPVKKWFLQTEFARRFDEDSTFWSVGFGYNL